MWIRSRHLCAEIAARVILQESEGEYNLKHKLVIEQNALSAITVKPNKTNYFLFGTNEPAISIKTKVRKRTEEVGETYALGSDILTSFVWSISVP